MCSSFTEKGPTSNWITFVPTENALRDTPGRLELITSVYWLKAFVEKTRQANRSS